MNPMAAQMASGGMMNPMAAMGGMNGMNSMSGMTGMNLMNLMMTYMSPQLLELLGGGMNLYDDDDTGVWDGDDEDADRIIQPRRGNRRMRRRRGKSSSPPTLSIRSALYLCRRRLRLWLQRLCRCRLWLCLWSS